MLTERRATMLPPNNSKPDKMSPMDQTMKKTTAQKSSALARLTDLQLASLFFSV
jgi:hypothetical protein